MWTGASVAQGGRYGVNAPTTPNILVRGTTSDNRQGPPIMMNVAHGFTDGFSFYYSSRLAVTSPIAPTVTLYSGLDGTGDVPWTSGVLTPTPVACLPHSGLFARWNSVDGTAFAGIAHSALFDGPSNNVAWDVVSFGLRTPPPVGVPEPAALGTFGLGALLIGLFAGVGRRFG